MVIQLKLQEDKSLLLYESKCFMKARAIKQPLIVKNVSAASECPLTTVENIDSSHFEYCFALTIGNCVVKA
jgi:hypothetical protein